MKLHRSAVYGFAALVASAPMAAHAEAQKLAVFDLQIAKGAPVPPTEDDIARVKRTSDELRTLLTQSGRFTLVPTDSVTAEADKHDLRACGGCADDLARKLGADAVMTGEVQKVSNLILNINVYLKPLKDGAGEKAYSVDLRGDTDESFDRGIKYLVKNRLLEGTP